MNAVRHPGAEDQTAPPQSAERGRDTIPIDTHETLHNQVPHGVGREITEKLLRQAGIGPGKRVLDLGCGQGDVSLLAGALVGARGQVTGVDRSEIALAVARERASAAGYTHVTFVHAGVNNLHLSQQRFDAIVGRRVLMYLPDPAETLSRASVYLSPGGVVAFQEHDGSMVPGRAVPFPLHEQVTRWVWATVEREGANRQMGFALPSVFARAGLALEGLHAEAITTTKMKPHAIGTILRAMLPRILQQGVASKEEIDLDTLDQRLDAEREARDAVFISDMVFYGWARKPIE